MREITRRRIRRAAEKALLFFGLMALMLVPGSSRTLPAAAPTRTVLVSIADQVSAMSRPAVGSEETTWRLQ